MRFLLVLAFAAMACAASIVPSDEIMARPLSTKVSDYMLDLADNEEDIELVVDPEDGTVEIAPMFIISWQVRRAIRKLQKQMPCGWPEYGVPPLAPLRVTEKTFHLQKSILETFNEIFRLRVDGLDAFQIKKFKLNIITSKVTFDFLFKNIKTTAQKYETNTILDALKSYGLSVQYEGDGTLDFALKNLRVSGTLKYKIPILWGSIKITSLKTKISLEKCESNISGFLGDGAINHAINRQIENFVEKSINDNQAAISDKIENTLVPKVNKKLKGNDFWTIYDKIFSSSEGEKEDDPIVVKCVPPADPWA